MYAIVGNDGFRPVVWGIGDSQQDAQDDAARYLTEANTDVSDVSDTSDTSDTDIYEITPEQARVIEQGDVAWPIVMKVYAHPVK